MTSPAPFDSLASLRAAGLRVTRPRRTVLEALNQQPHSSVEALAHHVRTLLGAVSTQAVYDVLRVCTEAGLVRRIEPAGSPAIFELDRADNHHHLVCRSCAVVVDTHCSIGAAPCLVPQEDGGFLVEEAEVVFWGLCPNCQHHPSVSATAEEASV